MKRAARRLLRRLGVEVVRYGPTNFPHLRRPLLLAEERIDLLIDGGASDGSWARAVRDAGYRGRIVSFEPLARSYGSLKRAAAGDEDWEARRVALADRAGTVELQVASNLVSSSLLPMLARHEQLEPGSAYVGSERVEAARLDDLDLGPAERIYLKLDLQGYELPALRGAEHTLTSVAVAEIELTTAPLYDGQALLPEVLLYLQERGLRLVGIEPSLRDHGTGDVLQANGLLRRA